MKKFIALFCLLIATQFNAQIKTPQPSPLAEVEQVVGLTNVSLKYSRPAMRGRTIFGDLVPFGQLWRTGANANTVISFEHDVTIANQVLEAGSYAIFTKPEKNDWTVYFYTDTNNWGTPEQWNEDKIAAQIEVKTQAIKSMVESFTIGVNHLSNSQAHLEISWEQTMVSVPMQFSTDEMVMNNINKVMNGPSANDFYNAAVYYLTSDKDINQSVKWIEKAMSMVENKPYWMLRQQSLIYAKAGMKNKAIDAAKASLKAAKKAGNQDYVKMNKDSLAEWQ